MELHTLKLVTIIAPRQMKDELIAMFQRAQITGYTYYDAFGKGERQLHQHVTKESVNLQFKVILPEIVATPLMEAVAEKYFNNTGVIIFSQDAQVIRYNKFDKTLINAL